MLKEPNNLPVVRESAKFKLACSNCGVDRLFTWAYQLKKALKNNSTCRKCANATNKSRWKGYGAVPHTSFTRMVKSAKSRGLSVEVTIEDVSNQYEKQSRKCALTGTPLTWGVGKKHNASIDRIDSTKGYLVDNIQIVTREINMFKRALHNKHFVELCKKVAANT